LAGVFCTSDSTFFNLFAALHFHLTCACVCCRFDPEKDAAAIVRPANRQVQRFCFCFRELFLLLLRAPMQPALPQHPTEPTCSSSPCPHASAPTFPPKLFAPKQGSIKDMIYSCAKEWKNSYIQKYTGKRGQPLPEKTVASFSRQILEGMMYLERKGWPYQVMMAAAAARTAAAATTTTTTTTTTTSRHHRHAPQVVSTGNVLLHRNQSHCMLADIESAILGPLLNP